MAYIVYAVGLVTTSDKVEVPPPQIVEGLADTVTLGILSTTAKTNALVPQPPAVLTK
jgi:hypothetical protein